MAMARKFKASLLCQLPVLLYRQAYALCLGNLTATWDFGLLGPASNPAFY